MTTAHLDDLTRSQRAVLDAITTSMARRGYPPTVRELAAAAGVTSTSSVVHQLKELESWRDLLRGGLV